MAVPPTYEKNTSSTVHVEKDIPLVTSNGNGRSR